jgi:beta-N-acetylhexosaminidase
MIKGEFMNIDGREANPVHATLELSELNIKIGRLFMAGMPGKELDAGTESLIRDYCLGGVILFSRNIESPVQLASLCKDLQEKAMTYHGIPLFLAIDQEGGAVARLREPFTVFPGNEAIGADPEPITRAREFAEVTAKEMALVGLNMDLAPVVDVRWGEPEKHLAGRTFSDDPKKVAMLGQVVIKALQENGVMAVAKHFPGLGKTSLDPHHYLPTIEQDDREMEEINLPPFKEAIAAGVSGIMTSHAIYQSVEPELPATLSNKILTELLRKAIGFKGLILTDDLEMGAIKKKWGVAEGAAASFEAGSDVLLICEDQTRILESIEIIRARLIRGEISGHRLHQSLGRIMAAKSRFLKKSKKVSIHEVSDYFSR